MPFHFIPDYFKTKGMCIKVVKEDPWRLNDVPGKFKTQEIFDKAVLSNSRHLEYISDYFKTQEMCIKAVEVDTFFLRFAPDHLKTQEMFKSV